MTTTTMKRSPRGKIPAKPATGAPPRPPRLEGPRPHEPRKHPTWMPGDKAHQGDLILVALAALPKSARPRADRQMAEGETRGSRHILRGGECYDADKGELARMLKAEAGMSVDARYIGPCFSAGAEGCVLEHPQHAHQEFPRNACTVVVYQRSLDMEEREQRQQD